MGGGCLRRVPEGKREDIPGMGAESNSLSPLTHPLLLFKSEDEQVLICTGWFWSKSGQITRDTQAKAHAPRDPYAYRQYSSEYSLFLRYYVFSRPVFMCSTFSSISFALCIKTTPLSDRPVSFLNPIKPLSWPL